MDKVKRNNKIITICLSFGLIMLMVGFTYAFFIYNKTGLYTHTIQGGKMRVIYDEITKNNITLDNAYPLTNEEALTEALEFEFTITGYNESEKNIYYAIEMDYGNDLEDETKERFKDTDIKISLYENNNLVIKNEIYKNLDNQDIYYSYINYGTDDDTPVVNNYKMLIWINDNVMITDTKENVDTTGKSVYSTEQFMNRYANFKVNVKADLTYDDVGYLTYDANGGSYTPKKTSLTTNMVTLQKPVMEGKGFLGWSTKRNGEVEFKSGDTYTGEGKILYAIYSNTRNVMNTFPTTITSQKDNITEVHFIDDTKENIDARYETATIKDVLTYENQGRVLGWLENDPNKTGKYILYVGSEGTTYLNTGYALFETMNYVTNIEFNNVDTSMVTDMSSMFAGIDLTELDLSGFNTKNVKNMSSMFSGCNDLISLDVSQLDISNVINLERIFSGLWGIITAGPNSEYNLNLGNIDTSKVTNMSYMFDDCIYLKELDLSNFNTSNVLNMSHMFGQCGELISLDVSGFDTSKVTNMSFMFSLENDYFSVVYSNLKTLDISHFDTNEVTNMRGMFRGCWDLINLDLSNFDTSKVEDTSYMFANCSNLVTIYCNNDWNLETVTSSSSMFYACNKLVGAIPYDSTKTDVTYANPDTGYFTRKNA